MSDPSIPPTVVIGDLSVTLVEPPSLMSLALIRAVPDNVLRGEKLTMDLSFGAAALRMCWPRGVAWPARPRPAVWVPGVRMARYGSEVWEGLRAATKATVPLSELSNAVYSATTFAANCAFTSADVHEARDFSESQGEE